MERDEIRKHFVLLSDVVPDAIQEIRYYTTYNFIGEQIDGYDEPCAILTKEAAVALKKVSDELLEQGYRLKIFDTYRPKRAVDHFVRWAEDENDIRMKEYFYPDVDKRDLFEIGYIARRSGHSRGSTVDLTLFEMASGKEMDMGSPFDYFGKRSHASFIRYLNVEQIKHRLFLRDAMVRNGFDTLEEEWWHFTLKNEPFPATYFDFPNRTSIIKDFEY